MATNNKFVIFLLAALGGRHCLLCQNARTTFFLIFLSIICITGPLGGANFVQHGQQEQEAGQGSEKEGSAR